MQPAHVKAYGQTKRQKIIVETKLSKCMVQRALKVSLFYTEVVKAIVSPTTLSSKKWKHWFSFVAFSQIEILF